MNGPVEVIVAEHCGKEKTRIIGYAEIRGIVPVLD